MKAKILLMAALLLASCTHEPELNEASSTPERAHLPIINSPHNAQEGILAIKIDPQSAEKVAEGTTRSGGTLSGVASIDRLMEELEGAHLSRLFFDPSFEERLQAAGLDRWYRLSFDKGCDLQEAAQSIASATGVELVQYMHLPKQPRSRVVIPAEDDATPQRSTKAIAQTNDTGLWRQWNFNNTGEIAGSIAGADINLFAAWELEMGDPRIVVAVLDEPIQLTHPDIVQNLWINTFDSEDFLLHGGNFCIANPNREIPLPINWEYRDSYGEAPSHGNHVAGIVAASTNNNIGVAGIAGGNGQERGVSLMCCQIFDYDENGRNISTSDAAARALIWAANRGAHIAQCSYGFAPDCTEEFWLSEKGYGFEREAIDYFIQTPREEGPITGGLVVFAAGNDGNSLYRGRQVKDQRLPPGCYSSTIAVAATSPDYTPGGYSSYGSWVDISAPGGDSDNFDKGGMIYSLIDTSGYGYMEGTSMACPHVSGVAALGLSRALDLGLRYSVEEFKSLLLSSTYSIEEYLTGAKNTMGFNYSSYQWEEIRIFLSDYQNKMGGGQVDAYRLMMAMEQIPIATVPCNEEAPLNLSTFFGGAAQTSRFSFRISDSEEAEQKLGLEARIDGNKLMVKCSERGCATIEVVAMVGESELKQSIALISRDFCSPVGGWL
uniref:S8 family serine peptidase n=1 Tax=Alistipes sp. TaxID=1872444 RepID=UPI004056314F